MRFLNALLITGVVLSGIGATATAAEPGQFPDISLPALKKVMAEGTVTLVDCNGESSFAKGHIAGAIEFYGNKSRLGTLLPADKGALVVIYCNNPRCGKYLDGAQEVERLGYTQIQHYAPGIRGWISAGEPTVASGNK